MCLDLIPLLSKMGRSCENGKDGKDGKNGKDGLNGKDGKDGRDGRDGKDGIKLKFSFGFGTFLVSYVYCHYYY